jgi:hypothetical protein
MTEKHTKFRLRQDGVVSMIVVIMIMLLLSLIVLAMSQNTNKERRQALDRQLSDQALYNAESGINDTINYLYNTPDAPIEYKDSCDMSFLLTPAQNPPKNFVDPEGVNRYTCVLYNKAPNTIEYEDVGISQDTQVVTVESLNAAGAPTPVSNLTFTWDDSSGSNTVSGCDFTGGSPTLLPKLPDNCTVGGLRVDIISARTNRDNIIKSMFNAYFLPHRNLGGSIGYGSVGNYPDNQGVVGQANCSGAPGQRQCKMTITGLNASKFTLHLRALYKSTDLTISGTDAAGEPVRFKNAQIMVDSTGRANDVLRRVQVRVPAEPQYEYEGFSIKTKDSICKLLNVVPNNVTTTDASQCPLN